MNKRCFRFSGWGFSTPDELGEDLPAVVTTRLAVLAGRRALERAELSARDLDLILVATNTGDAVMPALACRLESLLEAEGVGGYDVTQAESGFVYALISACHHVMSGSCRHVLVVGADCWKSALSREGQASWKQYFGEAGGAVVVSQESFAKGDLWEYLGHQFFVELDELGLGHSKPGGALAVARSREIDEEPIYGMQFSWHDYRDKLLSLQLDLSKRLLEKTEVKAPEVKAWIMPGLDPYYSADFAKERKVKDLTTWDSYVEIKNAGTANLAVSLASYLEKRPKESYVPVAMLASGAGFCSAGLMIRSV